MVKQDQNHSGQSKQPKEQNRQNSTAQRDVQKTNYQVNKKKKQEKSHDFDRNEGEERSQKI